MNDYILQPDKSQISPKVFSSNIFAMMDDDDEGLVANK